VRENEPPLTVVEILNPDITPADLSGKQIVLNVLARDPECKLYNVERQVRAHRAWSARSTFYLARTFTQQMKQGDDYTTLKPAIAIHLLDFTLFKDEDQAIWCFELRDREQHDVRLGEELQFNLIELPKADRLGAGGPALAAWVAFLKHWQEEQRMNEINYPPVKEAMDRIRDLSDDWAAWHEATRRQMAIMDEKQFRREAVEEGLAKGRAEGKAEGQAAVLERLISRRFGRLSEAHRERLYGATVAELESWTDRLLDAENPESVFSG